jgi:hypothetical protein
MKRSAILALGASCVLPLCAQTDFPGNPTVSPKKYTPRSVGGSPNTAATIDSGTSENPMVRYVTHIVLFENRIWTSNEGKPLQAKLIAFEDLTVEAPKGSPAPAMPAPPSLPTVTRGEKIRLLVDQKIVELPLARLSQPDQEFIAQIKAALAKKAAAGN